MLPYLGIFKQIFKYPLDMILEYYVLILFSIIIFFILRKARRIGYHRTLLIYQDGTHEIKDFKIKEGELQIRTPFIRKDNEWKPKVKSEMILPAKRTVGNILKPFGFKQRDILIAIEDAPECVTLKGISTLSIKDLPEKVRSLLLSIWTRKEIRKYIMKALAQGSVQRKMFDNTQFYIFVALLFGNLIMVFLIASRMGIF